MKKKMITRNCISEFNNAIHYAFSDSKFRAISICLLILLSLSSAEQLREALVERNVFCLSWQGSLPVMDV